MEQITSSQIREKIQNKESFVLDMFATWCGPCKTLLTNLEIAKKSSLSVPVYKFDIDSDIDFAVSEMGVRSVPTLKFFKGGEITNTKVGVVPVNDLVELINS